ncbi:CBS domain-containing protein [Desulfonatronovibrio hydrogenovorans]|uniref:CBS domain-containing protein n=1 Tax=Desulfonatronovibrio hydrogenovorans TaxID=53245 RepID=UPI00048CEF2E|nr:CBS domain-containing protein [Desulfonatronovibrio hydrogenovorans]
MVEKKPEHPRIGDLMVGLKEFPTISREAFFHEAHTALEKAQENFLAGRSRYRTLLVEDDKGQVVGKLSPMDLIQGLEPKYTNVIDPNRLKFKDTMYVIKSMKQKVLWDKPLDNLCQVAQHSKIKDFLKLPTEGHMVGKDDFLDDALHRFVVERHDSLFVVDGTKLVGLLLFADVYSYISNKIKESCTAG